jgi:hypothetical protein
MDPAVVGLFAQLDEVAAAGACHLVELSRSGGGGYRLEARPLAGSDGALDRSELLPLLPPGSRWFPARGWHAHFGWPLRVRGRWLFAIGTEAVAAAEPGAAPGSDGTAHPVLRAYLHEAPPVAAFEALAARLDPAPRESHPAAIESPLVLRPLPGSGPEASRAEQAYLLRLAAAAWRRACPALVRTVVLADAELAPLVAIPRRLPQGVMQALVGLPAALARTFSPRTQLLAEVRRLGQPF